MSTSGLIHFRVAKKSTASNRGSKSENMKSAKEGLHIFVVKIIHKGGKSVKEWLLICCYDPGRRGKSVDKEGVTHLS